MTAGRITQQTTEYGQRGGQYRVWVAQAPGIIEHHYVPSVRAAIDLLTGALECEGIAAGLEEHEDDGWHEWYDDRGSNVNELIDEADGEPVVLLGDVLASITR